MMDANGLKAFVIYIKKQNFWIYIIVSNVIANSIIVKRIAVFFDFVLLIESCLFLEVSQKFEKQTVFLSIICLHIMSKRKCKNAFWKCKSIVDNRQICKTSILIHKLTIYYFLLELLLIWLLLIRLHCGLLNSQ